MSDASDNNDNAPVCNGSAGVVSRQHRRRIGFYTNNPYIGGSELYLLNLINAMDSSQGDIFVFLSHESPLNAMLKERSGLTIVRLRGSVECQPNETISQGENYEKGSARRSFINIYSKIAPYWISRVIGFYRDVAALKVLLNKYSLDVFFANEHSPCCETAALAAKGAGVPKVISIIHAVNFSNLYLDDYINKQVMSAADIVIFPSRFAEKNWLRKYPVAGEKNRLIYTGVKIEEGAAGDLVSIERELGISPDTLLVCVPANFYPIKGHKFLVSAIPEIVKHVPGLKFVFLGDGPARLLIEDLVREARIAPYCVFAGFRSNVHAFMKRSDIIVLPSMLENLPIVLIEAMFSGKAVVATRVGGIPEIVEDGTTGVLVESNDVFGMTEALIGLLKAPGRRLTMGRNGLCKASMMFSYKIWLKNFEELCR